jgi:hypothetical protein
MTTPNQVDEWLKRYPGHQGKHAKGLLMARSTNGKIMLNMPDVLFNDCVSWWKDASIKAKSPTPGPSATPEEITEPKQNTFSDLILRVLIFKTQNIDGSNYGSSSDRESQALFLQTLHALASLPLVGLAAFCRGTTRFEAKHHFQDSKPAPWRGSSFVVSMGGLGMSWTYCPVSRRVDAIILNRDPNVPNPELISLLASNAYLFPNPLCLGFCILQWRLENFGLQLDEVRAAVDKIENDTYTFPFALDDVMVNDQVLYRNKILFQRLSNESRTLLEVDHKLGDLREYLAFLVRANTKLQPSQNEAANGAQDHPRVPSLTEKLDVLHDTLNIFTAETAWSKGRIANQVSAINQVTSTRDSFIRIQIARNTYRDGSSLITLAAVTLLFLPGIFVASVFTMPIFNWNAPHLSGVVNHRYWIYGTVAGSLTMAILLLWTAWFFLKRRWERKKDQLVDKTV